jgi:glucose-fructose oxidoreductase
MKRESWFYRRAQGGGSLLDYLGYGATLGAWFDGGRKPLEVTAAAFTPPGLEVDEHSITVSRYADGLSRYETRWGTFTDPWTHQTQPKTGFVLVGSDGTLSSYDYESSVRLQAADCPQGRDVPVDDLGLLRNPIEYFVRYVREGREFDGPLSPSVARIGQQIVDSAAQSIAEKRTVPLIG